MVNDDIWRDRDRRVRGREDSPDWNDERPAHGGYNRRLEDRDADYRGGGYGEYGRGGDQRYAPPGPDRGYRRERRGYGVGGYGLAGESSYDQNYGGGYQRTDAQQGRGMGDYGGRAYGDGERYGSGRAQAYRNEGVRDFGRGGEGYRSSGGGYVGERYGREDYGRGAPGDERRGWWDRTSDEVSSWFGDNDAERRRRMDAERAGQHRGRGPKNYARSDDRIREDVCDRLSDDPTVDASEVHVSVSDREVTLSGTVDSRDARRRAEDCADSISGVTHVQNNLRVQQGSTGSGFGTAVPNIATSGTSGGPNATEGSTTRTLGSTDMAGAPTGASTGVGGSATSGFATAKTA